MNELTIFNSEEFGQIRTVTIDGEPWFVGKDIATALGYVKPENAIATHVSDEDKTSTLIQGSGVSDEDKTSTLIQGSGSNYKSKAILINESGLYALIFGSKLESAKRFKHNESGLYALIFGSKLESAKRFKHEDGCHSVYMKKGSSSPETERSTQ